MNKKFYPFIGHSAVMGYLIGFLLWSGLVDAGAVHAVGRTTPLRVDGGLLTGQGRDVPLRDILDQLQRELGITYEVPATELDKPISYDLKKESLSTALTKLLASWDFAFATGPTGQIQTLFITPKVVLTPEERLAKEQELARQHSLSDRAKQEESLAPTAMDHFSPGSSGSTTGDHEFPGQEGGSGRDVFGNNSGESQNSEKASVAGVMPIRPPSKDMVMPITPASGSEMNITPPSSSSSMQIIPPTAYPPMTINPVPEHLKAEMLGAIGK